MDKPLEPKKGISALFTAKRLPYVIVAAVVLLVIAAVAFGNTAAVRVNPDTLQTATVTRGQFNDYIRVSGQVQPLTSVQISTTESGVVSSIVAEEGSHVKAGDVIAILTNESLDMQILNSEADLAEKENILRNTLISMEQQRLAVRQEKLQLQMEVRRTKRAYEQNRTLYAEQLISREEFLTAEEDYNLAADKLELVRTRETQDSLYRSVEVGQMQESLRNMRLNMQMIRRRKDNLTLKAPIDGELGLLNLELGQSVMSGTKVGQLSSLSDYKVETQIDEHYIDRVSAGLEATVERQNEKYSAVLRKVYPEVRDGKFKADFRFHGDAPDNMRTGQTYYLNLQLGQPAEATMLRRGAFFQSTGGKWVYVLTPDGTKAVKREIHIGRQNPQYYEVTDGLAEGERVIVSGYDRFGDNEVLILE